jgi:hypothetical protein
MVLGKAPRKKSGVAGQKCMAGRRFESRQKKRLEEKATNVANERNAAHRVA